VSRFRSLWTCRTPFKCSRRRNRSSLIGRPRGMGLAYAACSDSLIRRIGNIWSLTVRGDPATNTREPWGDASWSALTNALTRSPATHQDSLTVSAKAVLWRNGIPAEWSALSRWHHHLGYEPEDGCGEQLWFQRPSHEEALSLVHVFVA
jgi:hypothetical protein